MLQQLSLELVVHRFVRLCTSNHSAVLLLNFRHSHAEGVPPSTFCRVEPTPTGAVWSLSARLLRIHNEAPV